MKVKIYLIVMAIVLLISLYAFAQSHNYHGHKGSITDNIKSGESTAVQANNKVCPVSGRKVGEMGSTVNVEHKGKIYNFCCSECVEIFKADPDKYVKIIKDETGEENGHKGHHHIMGEMDHHVQTKTSGKELAHAKKKVSANARVKEFDLEAYQHGYSPERLVVKKGDIVKLNAISRDVSHGIFIRGYGINVPVKKGTVEKIEFVADKAGEFDILCSVYCGKGHYSMKAKLVVKK